MVQMTRRHPELTTYRGEFKLPSSFFQNEFIILPSYTPAARNPRSYSHMLPIKPLNGLTEVC